MMLDDTSPRGFKRPRLLRGGSAAAHAVAPLDIVDHDILEVGGDGRAAECHRLLAVDEYRRGGLLAGAGQRDTYIRVLGLARSVDDATHHGDVEGLHAR